MVWGTRTVFLSGPRSAVHWMCFQPNTTLSNSTLTQSGTIGSSDTFYRAYSSLAVNSQNDVLIGYNRFIGSEYPSAFYSFRAGSDAANSMQSERLLHAGEGYFINADSRNKNRWGDYNAAVVDPINDKDMWTIVEASGTPLNTSDHGGQWKLWWGRVSNFRRMAAGLMHGLAQYRIGGMAFCGQDVDGQLGDGGFTNRSSANAIGLQTIACHIGCCPT